MTRFTDLFDTARHQFQNKTLFDQARDYAFDYMAQIHGTENDGKEPARPVFPPPDAVEGLDVFDEPLPREPGIGEEILKTLHTHGSPATVAQSGGRYFGFVNGSSFPVALAARWLADTWDQNAALNVMSPAAARLEQVCEAWLKELFGLPEETVAGFVSGTSAATLCGLAAARNQILSRMGWDVRSKGLFNAPKPRVILGEQAHSTVFKALSLIGFGMDDLEQIPCDSQGRMRADLLPEIDKTCMVIAQAGNVNTGAFDLLDDICEQAKDAWVHVDGAFGLWAAGSSNCSHLTRGLEKADSWSVDAHKTLNTPYDCGIILCRHPDALVSALQNSGDYITYGDRRDPMLYTPEMSRRARGVELWATMKFLGKSGIQTLVDRLCARAQNMGRQLEEKGFILHNDVVFNQVLVSCPDENITKAILVHLQEDGTCWCGSSVWQGKAAIRISVCSWVTTDEDIDASVRAFVRAREMAQAGS